jgi:hypothetical protein
LEETPGAEFKVFPNPVLENIIFFNDYISQANVKLLTLSGQVVQMHNNFNGNSVNLDKTLVPGIYFLEIITTKSHSIKKLILVE